MILKVLLDIRINNIQDLYKNIEEYNLGKKRKILIIFDDRLLMWLMTKNLIQ